MKKSVFAFLLIFGLSTAAAFSQSRHYTSQSVAMGSGGTAYVDGFNANFLNPANLMLDMHRANTTIGFMSVGAKAGGSLANVALWNKYLTTNQLIAGQTRENMLSDWFGSNAANARDVSAGFSMAPLGVSHRRAKQAFSFASRIRVAQDFSVNKGLAELYFYGLDSDKFANPTPVDFSSNTVAFAEISVGYARHLDFLPIPDLLFAKDIKLFVGVAPKYLYGVYTTNLDFNSTIQVTKGTGSSPSTINHKFNYSLQTIGEISRQMQAYERARSQDKNAKFEDYVFLEDVPNDFGSTQASGFGLDFGGTLEMDVSALPIPLFIKKDKTLRISMSVTDLGKLSYNKDASSVYANGEFTYNGAEDKDDINYFFDNLADSLQNDVYGDFSSKEIKEITYNLPAMYNFGASLEMGNLLLALDYGVGFNNNSINSSRSFMSLGVQYRLLGFIPLRVGTRVGGYSSTAYSAGIGLDLGFLEFTVGASNVANSEKSGSSAGAAWSGLVFRF